MAFTNPYLQGVYDGLAKPLNVYMMCSLYASVQGIDDSPFLPHRALYG